MLLARQSMDGPSSTGSQSSSVRFGSAADTTRSASTSVPSASVTPRTRPSLDRISVTSEPVLISAPAALAADASAAASPCVPPRANTAVPAAPPSFPAESFRNTAAVPADHGPHAVKRTPRVERGPRMASSSNTSWTRSATAIGIARIASRPYLAPSPLNAQPTLRPEIASAIVGALMSGGVATLT
jgi:hypothetical protein